MNHAQPAEPHAAPATWRQDLKSALILAATAIAAAGSSPALANAKLAQEKQCMQCHAVDRDTIGPSFQTIASVYRSMRNPERMLMAVIREGNDANLGPHWGRARMPNTDERPLVSAREARQLARWILAIPSAAGRSTSRGAEHQGQQQ